MADSFKLLADGQLAASKTAMLTVGGAAEVVIQRIKIAATTGTDRTFGLYVKTSGGTSRRITPAATPCNGDGHTNINGPITLGNSEVLEGDASAATELDYTVHGDEIS